MSEKVLKFSQKFIFYIAMVLFAAFTAYLAAMGAFVWFNGGCTAFDNAQPILRGISMLLGAVFCVAVLGLFYKKISTLNERMLIKIAAVSGVCMFVLQILFVVSARAGIRYDSLKVVDEAIALFSQPGILASDLEGYFARYANNYAMTILAHWMLKVFRMIGIVKADFSNAVLVLQIINVLFVDVAFVGAYAFIKKYFGQDKASLFVLYMALNPLSYVWLPFFYTNTVSMAFAIWGVYLLFSAFEAKAWKNVLLYAFGSGVLFYAGYKIRATVFIALIAGLLAVFCKANHEKEKAHFVQAFKQMIVIIMALVFAMGVCAGVYKVTEKHYLAFDATDTAFPLTHWVAMGLNAEGDGSFNALDEQNTMNCETALEKKEATVSLIKERVHDLGLVGVTKLYMKKLSNTFADGAGGYHSELNISKDYGMIWQVVYGVHRDPVLVWTQIFYLVSLLCGIAVSIGLFTKKLSKEAFALVLLLLGSYMFQMIWESATIYSIGTMYLNGCMVALGLPLVENYVDSKQKAGKIAKNVSMALGAVGLLFMIIRLATTDYVEVSVGVDQFLFQAADYPSLSYGQCITQTFCNKKDFSTIALRVRNLTGAYNDSTYEVRLYDQEGNLLQTEQIVACDIEDFGYCRMPFHNQPGITDYELKIEKTGGSQDLIFLYYDTGHYDVYPDGQMSGPVEGNMADLLFSVYDREEE